MKITSLIQLKALEGLDSQNKPINILRLSRNIKHDSIALAHHLRHLQTIGLVSMKREGRQILCQITPEGEIVSRLLK